MTRDRQDVAHILETLAAAYARGVPFKMDELFSDAGCRRTVLPLYPFRRDRHWLNIEQHSEYDPASAPATALAIYPTPLPGLVAESPPSDVAIPAALHPLLGRVVSRATHRATFETDLAASQPWVDHRILGATVFPGAAYLEMAVRGFAASQGLDWMATQLHDVGFERPLVLGYGKSVKVTLNLETRPTNGKAESNFVIGAVGDGNAGPYCRGRVSRAGDDAEKVSVHDLLARINAKQQIGAFYGELRQLGFEYGAGFSTIRDLWLGGAGFWRSHSARHRLAHGPMGRNCTRSSIRRFSTDRCRCSAPRSYACDVRPARHIRAALDQTYSSAQPAGAGSMEPRDGARDRRWTVVDCPHPRNDGSRRHSRRYR